MVLLRDEVSDLSFYYFDVRVIVVKSCSDQLIIINGAAKVGGLHN